MGPEHSYFKDAGIVKYVAVTDAQALEAFERLAKIEGINEVEGFDPTPFAVDYTDLETGEVRKRLPVMIQMAWFRMKYPEGRIAITVSP